MAERAWWPRHPDNPEHGTPLGARLGYRESDELPDELTEEQVVEMWKEDQERRAAEARELAAATPIHQHGCGHDCTSGGCWVLGLMQSFNCPECAIRLHLA